MGGDKSDARLFQLFRESLGHRAGPVSPLDVAGGGDEEWGSVDFITEVTLTQPAQEDREESREGPLWLKFLSCAGKAQGHRDWR